MSNPEQSDSPMYTDVSELLFAIANMIRDIDKEADEISTSLDYHREYSEKMRERAILVRSIPSIVHDYEVVGGLVPTKVRREVNAFSAQAAQLIESNNINAMRDLLDGTSNRIGEPNKLEMLAILTQPDNLNVE